MNESDYPIPANFPSTEELINFGAYTVGVLDGYLKDGGTAEDVLNTLFTGALLTHIPLPLEGK